MNNDRLHPLFRAAFEDLRDGNAALARAASKGPLQPTGLRMPNKPLSYDSKCFSLAEDFLDDHRPFTEAEAQDLAQTIQDAIESWFADREAQAIKRLKDSLQTEEQRLLEEQP